MKKKKIKFSKKQAKMTIEILSSIDKANKKERKTIDKITNKILKKY